jgi:hypothetical protein
MKKVDVKRLDLIELFELQNEIMIELKLRFDKLDALIQDLARNQR